MKDSWRCEECRKITKHDDLLKAANPFDDSDTITGCPSCRVVNSFVKVCDEPECEDEVSCGWPDKNENYRLTCHQHYKTQPQAD